MFRLGPSPIGTRVKILQDVRPGQPATGAYATYEGHQPYSVILADRGHVFFEVLYEPYIDGRLQVGQGLPTYEVFPIWEQSGPEPDGPYAIVVGNPRLRLDDGSVIWGAECWWTFADPGEAELERQHTLEQAKEALDQIDDWLNSGGK